MNGPFSKISKNLKEISRWCQERLTGRLLYLSADIRNAGFKVSPVDVNIFPAGFHILNEESQGLAAKLIQANYTGKTILLITESHTRNIHYLKNVRILKKLFEKAKNTVILCNPDNQAMESLEIQRFHIHDRKIITENGIIPDLVVLNNDMISLDPSMLAEVIQPCIPSPLLGWCKRKKTQYFMHYLNIVEEFSRTFGFDPWVFSTHSDSCSNINFDSRNSIEDLADVVDRVLEKVQKKYEQHKIKSKPFVFIKANNGSYGMGILTVHDAQSIFSLNKKERNKLKVTKGNIPITEVIVQEGVETTDSYLHYPSETLMYSILGKKVAFLLRYNTRHNTRQNLNSSGMCFVNCPPTTVSPQLQIVSDLAIIAAEHEAKNVEQGKTLATLIL